MSNRSSLADGQRSISPEPNEYPLWPPLTEGCPETSTDEVQYPLEITYDYDEVDRELFEVETAPEFDHWQQLLPPLNPDSSLGEGGTPLIRVPQIDEWLNTDADIYVKDESQNPTWSQKDRLNRCVVSAATAEDADGIVVSSSGNHGAAAAAYAARVGLRCVVFTSPETPDAVNRFLTAYDAAVVAIDDWDARQEAVDTLATEYNYHPASTRTRVHTGHPFGPEGYKTIAYEVYVQLGQRVPGTVFVPTCHAELLYGVWKGFRELAELGVTTGTPEMVACEPGRRGPLAAALDSDREIATVNPEPTAAYSIKATRNTYRGITVIRESDGRSSTFTEEQLDESQKRLADAGLWQEASGAAGVAGLQSAVEAEANFDGPIVCLATSSGFKDGERATIPTAEPEWKSIRETLASEYDCDL